MNVLAHRNISQMEVTGTEEVNDRPIGSEITSMSAYIQQEDLFVGSLTVKEHLTFQVGKLQWASDLNVCFSRGEKAGCRCKGFCYLYQNIKKWLEQIWRSTFSRRCYHCIEVNFSKI